MLPTEAPESQNSMTDDVEGLYRILCENSCDLLQSASLEGRFLYVNRAWCSTLGYRPEEVERLKLADVIHPDSLPSLEGLCSQPAGQARMSCEIKFRARDGREILTEGITGCRFQNNRSVGTYGIYRDISQSRKTEEGLHRLFALSLDLLCIAGTDGYFKETNPAFQQVLGYTREELLSKSFLEFVHPDDRACTLETLELQRQGLPVVDFQNRYRARDGTFRWLAWRAAPPADQDLIYAVARDITEQKRIEELMKRQATELARSNADLEQFAYVASHDLRAPLRAVANLTEWIEEGMQAEQSDEVRHHLRRLRQTVRRMERLTGDILQYSRAGRDPDEISRVDTAELLRDLNPLLALPEGFTLIWEPDMPVFETAKSPLEQVFRNLVGNAFKHHNRRDGKIIVAVRDLTDFYEFSIIDDGPGIPAESLEKIFTMFFKLRSESQAEGTGIGLALVKRIVESHGGRVWAESVEGSGAIFRFTWPKRIDQDGGRRAGHPDS